MTDDELTTEQLRERLRPPPTPTSLALLYEQASPLERLDLLASLRVKLEVETGQRALRPGEPAL